ncbi:suppressor of fused domain protein [Clostridium sp. ZS2-4]|uniref:suppressor of fused domain protein n=1 Tax=Clostridium sp. ZS2-4 TaxID=2987703 RepID=UPI00227B245C|nr:suppressor of fused domain protein [Clostridium sp. ZS2-4]MCY6354739.1 suppressor of fused domain protein [Clostridium sp. ZS2-4]
MDIKNINMRIIGKFEKAIRKHDLDLLKQLLEEYPEYINYEDSRDGTLLRFAAMHGNVEIVKYILSLGLDINKGSGEFYSSALEGAVFYENIDVVKYLLDAGAEIDTSNIFRNPLFSVTRNEKVDCTKLLIDRGIDLSISYQKESGEFWDALRQVDVYARNRDIVDLIERELYKQLNYKVKKNKDYSWEDDDKIVKHIEKYIGTIDQTISEIIPGSRVRINVNIIKPKQEKDYITLITNGMSAYPMGYAQEDEEYKYAELMIKLPSDWKLDETSCKTERYGWPLKILRMFAHLPHQSEGYINERVIIPNGIPDDIPLPFHVDTWLSTTMFCVSEDIPFLRIDKDIRVDFFTLVPICEEEIDSAKKMGNNEFMHILPTRDVVDEERGFED